jgi:DNA-binding GntR family transcriptional regulator
VVHTDGATEPNAVPYTVRYTAAEAPPTTAVGTAYGSIKESLLLGEYPIGVRLVEERLGRDIGVSRTPVREALLRLHAEGLVCRHPSGGYSPTVPNIAETRELYEVRVALERSGILRPRSSGRPHDAMILRTLRDDWTSLAEVPAEPSPEFVVFDEAFHVRLAEAAGNRELAELLRRINERIRVVRMRDFLTTDRITRTVNEHLELLTLVIDGDLDAAIASYDTHVQTSLDVVEQRVAGALLQMAAHR